MTEIIKKTHKKSKIELKDNEVVYRGRIVTQSNALIRANQSLSLNEKRAIALAISQNDSRNKAPTKEIKLYAKDFAESYGIDEKNAYDQLKEAGKSLMRRVITFNKSDHILEFHWVNRAIYREGKGYIVLEWSDDILLYLFELKKEFTSYKLEQASNLRSTYSWRLLELLNQFGNSTKQAIITYDDFCHVMEATEKQKANFYDIKRRIIEPAVKELFVKDNIVIEWEAERRGRRVSVLKFSINDNKQMALSLENSGAIFDGLSWSDMTNCYYVATGIKDEMKASKIHDDWYEWIVKGGLKPRDKKASFIGFVKKKNKL